MQVYCYIRENGGFDNFEVIPILFLKLENKTQLLIEEQKEMDKHLDLKNKCKSHRTEEQKKDKRKNRNKQNLKKNQNKKKNK